ncbi:BrnT family toxin [Thermodesulfovibrionales bacterium]|nr:BrnT family toxin [Thermodesulfovibrionales bacterium]MCL0036913.1 BrnT family toxin [Thermodesulfovibrionales bacterium]MCL0038306.1 BrnT family toxin [Thermodesulfovibrionales bacterium]MCL0051733.1 BrnT family toxin [Thermodesulfovibrionales bacterium]MCL0062163.1 BrnT family toxin [Thermodesulfovibrionales bacterium]
MTIKERLKLWIYVTITLIELEWDQNKAASNLLKHGVLFDEAKTVFDDPLYVDFYDPDHSYNGHRYIIIGHSLKNRLLIVAYAERKNKVRLISAREATRREQKVYEEG